MSTKKTKTKAKPVKAAAPAESIFIIGSQYDGDAEYHSLDGVFDDEAAALKTATEWAAEDDVEYVVFKAVAKVTIPKVKPAIVRL